MPTEPGWYLVRVEDVGEVAEWGPMVEADILEVHERLTKEREILIGALAHAAQEFNDMRVATGFFDEITKRVSDE